MGEPSDKEVEEYQKRLQRGALYRALTFGTGKQRRVAAIVVAGLLLGLYGWRGGPWLVDRAKQADTACSNANYSREPGASLECEGRAAPWLWPAKVIPWARGAARDRELRIRSDEAKTRLELSTEVHLDPSMRDGAIADLLKVVAEPDYPSELRRHDWVFAVVASTGSREQIVKLAEQAKGGFDAQRALQAAAGLGDFEQMVRLAAREDPDENAYEHDLRRGAALCLAGDAAAGQRALESAKQRYQSRINHQYAEAQAALLLCGRPAGSEQNSTYRETVWLADLLANPDPRRALDRIRPDASYTERANDLGLPFFATALAGGAIPSVDHVFKHCAMLKADLGLALTPWVAGGPASRNVLSSHPIGYDPVVFERAADELERLAGQLESGALKLAKPDEDDYRDPFRFTESAWKKHEAEPWTALRSVAFVLRFQAVIGHAAVYDAAAAKKAAALASKNAGSGVAALLLGSHLVRMGDRKAARALYEKVAQEKDAAGRLYASLNLALLELGERRPREALAWVKKAAEVSSAANASLGDLKAFDMSRSVGWVAAAAALLAEEQAAPATVAVPTYFVDDEGGRDLRLPPDWLALARADDRTRRVARFRMFDPDINLEERSVLPAVIYVLRQVARDGKSPEVWVDKVLPLFISSVNGVTGLRARAEAARFAGDEAGAATWDERASRLEKTMSTPKKSVLGELAQLR